MRTRRGSRSGTYSAVGEYDPDAEEAGEVQHVHPHETKEGGRITLRADEPEASSSKEPRPSTDDETARLSVVFSSTAMTYLVADAWFVRLGCD